MYDDEIHFHPHWEERGGHRRGPHHRGHGHPHHPHQGGPFGEQGFGRGRGEWPGRKFSSEDLSVLILALLADKPAHGYELIKEITERSSGFYAPSPGVIYPALMFLHEQDFLKVDVDGTRKLYELTAAGKKHLEEQRATADRIFEILKRIGGRMEDVRDAFSGAHEFESEKADAVHRARHGLKDALRSKRGCGPKEALRIAKILERATAEILGDA
jgi:DNA-binding PadR family transcriptional regulator